MNNDETQACCIFESDDFVLRGRPDLSEYVKPGAGFALRVLRPGRPADLYHAESVQEDFLVVMGECILIIEDQERHLRAWDFVHCPPGVTHTFVGAGDGPCVIVCAGNVTSTTTRSGASTSARTSPGATARVSSRTRTRTLKRTHHSEAAGASSARSAGASFRGAPARDRSLAVALTAAARPRPGKPSLPRSRVDHRR